MAGNHLNTICTSGLCPNKAECWKAGTATLMIGGNVCTRNCRFCNIDCGRPAAPDPAEPEHIAEAAKALNLRHVVITQVTRDDLPDGGAAHMAAIVRTVRKALPEATIETLISGGHANVALGNVVGSNIANLLLVLALSVLITPVAVSRSIRRNGRPQSSMTTVSPSLTV